MMFSIITPEEPCFVAVHLETISPTRLPICVPNLASPPRLPHPAFPSVSPTEDTAHRTRRALRQPSRRSPSIGSGFQGAEVEVLGRMHRTG